MSKRGLILVEGQTEERFVKDILAPIFDEWEFFLEPTLLRTKLVKSGSHFKGGVTNFDKFKNDLIPLLKGSGGAFVTTLLDYYGLPTDFPGMNTRPQGTPLQRVQHVENAIRDHFGSLSHFVPFLALHEFEAWLFSSEEELPKVMKSPEKQSTFAAIIQGVCGHPEEINERPEHAPSKQIMQLFPGFQKTLHGPITAKRIGLSQIRERCPHFNDWLIKLETFAKV